MRTIDADALMPLFIKKANTMKDRHGVKLGDEWLLNYNDLKDVIDNAPTVEPQKIVIISPELIEKLASNVVDVVSNIDWEKAIEAYKARPQGEWIPVSERLPEDLEPVNITWINHEPEPYYKEIKDKPFTATGVYFKGQWYWWSTLCTDMLAEYQHNHDDIIDEAIEIIAWQPLPESYRRKRNDN